MTTCRKKNAVGEMANQKKKEKEKQARGKMQDKN